MERTADWPRVFVDAAAFRYFAQTECCTALNNYLGDKLRITLDVETELRRAPESEIKLLTLVDNWPPGGAVQLPARVNDEARRIIRLSQDEGDHPNKNAGEVTTVMAAEVDGEALVIAEDRLAKRESRKRGVRRLSTVELVAEMVVTGHLPEDTARSIIDRCLGDRPDDKRETIWQSTLRRSRSVNVSDQTSRR